MYVKSDINWWFVSRKLNNQLFLPKPIKTNLGCDLEEGQLCIIIICRTAYHTQYHPTKEYKRFLFLEKTCKFGVNVWVGRQRLGKSSPDNWGRRRVLVRSNIYEVPNQRCKCCLQLTDNCKNIEMSYNKLIKTIN